MFESLKRSNIGTSSPARTKLSVSGCSMHHGLHTADTFESACSSYNIYRTSMCLDDSFALRDVVGGGMWHRREKYLPPLVWRGKSGADEGRGVLSFCISCLEVPSK